MAGLQAGKRTALAIASIRQASTQFASGLLATGAALMDGISLVVKVSVEEAIVKKAGREAEPAILHLLR